MIILIGAYVAIMSFSGEWANPLNTLLLIGLVYVTNKFNRKAEVERKSIHEKVDLAHEKITAVHEDVSSSVAAALAAAEAAAHAAVASNDTARIAKELGNRVRNPHREDA